MLKSLDLVKLTFSIFTNIRFISKLDVHMIIDLNFNVFYIIKHNNYDLIIMFNYFYSAPLLGAFLFLVHFSLLIAL